jgi:hypothetical protein
VVEELLDEVYQVREVIETVDEIDDDDGKIG